MTASKTLQLKEIRDEIVDLKASPLYEYRKKNNYFPVIGQGNHEAKIIFIGEAPGKTEAETGVPFCGAAGRILDGLLESIGLDRKGVYITNVVKDRPPNNRDPQPAEIELYSPFLARQIEIIKPEVVVALGRFSTKYILEKFDLPEKNHSITSLHGKPLDAIAQYGPVKIVPMYHPAVALYSTAGKKVLEEDFKILKGF